MKKSILINTSIVFVFVSTASFASMYLPLSDSLPKKEMESIGLQVTPEEVSSLATEAVGNLVWTKGACTTTFLSPNGMIGTNWHCAQSCAAAIQAEENTKLVQEGYLATSPKEEKKCVGYEVKVPTEIRNISSEFVDLETDHTLAAKDWAEKVRLRTEELREKCRGKSETVVCNVVKMNTGKNPYYMYKYKRLTDVRLVWIPPVVIGEFGGETDNWEYPRHTADFSFLRVYDHDKPYHPKKFARVSWDGVKPGDPQFILGYPGSTSRNITSFGVDFLANVQLPLNAKLFHSLLGSIRKLYPTEPQNGPYARAWLYLMNYAENFKRKAELIKKTGVSKIKRKEEAKLTNLEYLKKIRTLYQEATSYYPRYALLEFITSRRMPANSVVAAHYIWQWTHQPADDKQRKYDHFKSWNKDVVKNVVETSDSSGTYSGDISLLADFFQFVDQNKGSFKTLAVLKTKARNIKGKESIYQKMAHLVYDNTKLVAKNDSPEERTRAKTLRLKLLASPASELDQTSDSLLLFMRDVNEELESVKNGVAEQYVYGLARLNYEQNVLEGKTYPDANSTVRFTLSTVQKEYRPIYKKGTYPYATTLHSMVKLDHFAKKGTDDYELFLVPDYIKEAEKSVQKYKNEWFYDPTTNNVPVNFITQHIITGGNSGSSVFNAKGEVVGFAFDGTPESILDDVQLHPASRTIIFDLRFLGFLAATGYPQASWILEELKKG